MKKVSKYRGWSIYYDKKEDTYYCFLPDESPLECCSPEWEGGSVQELKDFINSYGEEAI